MEKSAWLPKDRHNKSQRKESELCTREEITLFLKEVAELRIELHFYLENLRTFLKIILGLRKYKAVSIFKLFQ